MASTMNSALVLMPPIPLASLINNSVRLWKLGGKTLFGKLICDTVLRVKNVRGVRCGCSSASFDREGKYIVHGTVEGGVVLHKVGDFQNRPLASVHGAHLGKVVSVAFSNGNDRVATRGEDGTVKIFDFRKLKAATGRGLEAVADFKGLETGYDVSNLCFSPDDKMVCVGTCVRPGSDEESFLKFLGVSGGEVASAVIKKGVSAVCVAWPAKLNQIVVGLSNGDLKIFYDPSVSTKGALLCAKRKARKVRVAGSTDISIHKI